MKVVSEGWTTCDLYDAHEGRVETCGLPLRHYGGRRRFRGRVATVRCFEDNVLLRETLSEPGAGRVLVADGAGSLRCALMGDQIAAMARENGWSGIVINGAVRDVDTLATLDFGILALASNPRKSAKQGAGETGGTVDFGGVRFRPGGWVYCDADGILYADEPLID